MPAPEFSNGRAYIWITACILFTCIVAGGACLVAYVLLPEDQVESWLPVAGVVLVCLPWAFWLLTFIYRIVSRAFGFRVRFGGGGGDGGRRAGNEKNYSGNDDIEGAGGLANGKGDVQFGEAGGAAARGGLQRTSSSVSNESEMPLAKSLNS
ncbi:uncharacterized protein LOC129308999 [Prosopis cineraria]|uniref:uncharacterized protein LOC129296472 n=1 Tax=Prosopis cineraria TaxID=364024 RepID=UPI00240FB8DC|nr:uncharacterized protein LOC129296472 [Prosopis cineraria]XP_054806324.1 uncharacterized protein LOC129308999 [Prosopis cineraria]